MGNELAIVKKSVIDVVQKKIDGFVSSGELRIHPAYSVNNAMKAAWLTLQGTIDKNKQPVLKTCTQESIANALLDMVVQGLNPARKQGYFIAYGKQLAFQRSYHGSVAVVKSLCGAKDVGAQVVWGPDEFEYEIIDGVKFVTKHKQKLGNIGKDPQGAYCTIILDDRRTYTDIMTMEQIKVSWSKSKGNPSKADSTHSQFPEEMIKRTVISRACKKYINSASDSAILQEAFERSEIVDSEERAAEILTENANQGPVLDVESDEIGEAFIHTEAQSEDDVPIVQPIGQRQKKFPQDTDKMPERLEEPGPVGPGF